MGPEMQDTAVTWPGGHWKTEQSAREDAVAKGGTAWFTTPC